MRITLSIALMSFGASTLQAQESQPLLSLPTTRTELGIFGQTDMASNEENMSMAGVQYKKMINEKKGFRVIAGVSGYHDFKRPFSVTSSGDTTIERFTAKSITLGIIGGGVEMQRHFYKKVYLFAALELRGGYGTGKEDTLNQMTSSTGLPYISSTNGGSANATMVYVGFMPSIGAKLQFKRITLGTELTAIEASFKQIKVAGSPNYGTSSMSTGSFSQRFFVNYRF